MPQKVIELHQVADFTIHLDGREIISVGVGPQDEALVLAVQAEIKNAPLARHEQPGWASFPRSKVDAYDASVLVFQPDFAVETAIQGIEEAYPHIQPLPHGGLLIAAARCHNRVGKPEQNAAVYDSDGQLQRRFVLGDGINHVQVAQDGTIWTGYFDEGVFGNYGWDKPMGAPGVVRFNASGKVLWKFEPPSNCDYIADCYAMNTAPDATWLCYYTDFPIVKIEPDGRTYGWVNEFGGARALVTDNYRVILFGGYQGHRSRCVIQEFGNDKMVRSREIKLALPDSELPERMRVVGRGSVLHFFIGAQWFQLNLATLDV